MKPRLVAGAFGIVAPLIAAAVVLVAGWMTPGYDPLARTISRLAEPGLPSAFAIDLAICLVGIACLALALTLGPGSTGGRTLLAGAGLTLLVAAAIHLDPASGRATTEHRLATFVAMLALIGAPLAFASSLKRSAGWERYGRISFVFGAAEVGTLLVGLALLPTTFAGWGAWERCFLALPIAWMVILSWRLVRASRMVPMFSSTTESSSWVSNVSAEDNMNAAAASQSSGGS
jgi:hypothetical protein